MMLMANTTQRTERRTDALSRERIIEAAIGILDAGGESALTFRALAAHLATGAGAIYWHVADKNELLAAATDDVIARAMTGVASGAEPRQAIRAIALGLFDAIEAHSWAGAQLSRAPWQSSVGEIFESVGSQVDALGVTEQAQLDVASALVHYILGCAGQNAANAANARLLPPDTDRTAFLETVIARWTRRDPAKFPFLHKMAARFSEHDDRAQFLAGIDLILAGIATVDRN
jgi:AcrR family transcriptional regulator